MSTVAPAALNRIYGLIDPYLSSMKRSGIVNANSPGYHTSRQDLQRQGRGGDYSIQCPADRRGPSQNATGIDITLNQAEMRLVTTRLRTACAPVNGKYDPRIECLREFIGSLDGRNVSGYNRVATGSASRSRVGWHASGYSDSSHRWHIHGSVLRDYAGDDNQMRGLAEVIAGQPAGAFGWKGKTEPAVITKYYVDPKKVDTVLLGIDRPGGAGSRTLAEHPPGTAVYTVRVVTGADGRRWAVTEDGIHYSLDLLTPTKPEGPGAWDGTYPGPTQLTVGARGPWVKWVGDRLAAHGIPGAVGEAWSQAHTDGVVAFKRKQGWTGGPTVGEATWALLAAPPTPPAASKPAITYQVQAGDTLSGIASRLGIKDWQALAALNPGINPNLLRVGQVLAVPKPVPPHPEQPKEKDLRFTVGSHNKLDSSNNRARLLKPYSKRQAALAKFYKDLGSVILLQEVGTKGNRESDLKGLAAGLGSNWRYTSGGDPKDDLPLGILFRLDLWDWVKTDPKKLTHFAGFGVRWCVATILRDKASGREVCFVTTHLAHKGSSGDTARRKQMRDAIAHAEKVAGNRPIVLGADVNDPDNNKAAPKGILREKGFTLLEDMSGVKNRKSESHHGLASDGVTQDGKWIDVLAWRGLDYDGDGALVDTHKLGISDHNALQVRLKGKK